MDGGMTAYDFKEEEDENVSFDHIKQVMSECSSHCMTVELQATSRRRPCVFICMHPFSTHALDELQCRSFHCEQDMLQA